jgi:hypothetical protein
MNARVYILRDHDGNVTWAGTHKPEAPDPLTAYPVKHCDVKTTKQLVVAMLQTGSRTPLVDAAWKKAVRDGAVNPSRAFQPGEAFDCLTVGWAQDSARTLDGYISEIVNNPRSRFYLHG